MGDEAVQRDEEAPGQFESGPASNSARERRAAAEAPGIHPRGAAAHDAAHVQAEGAAPPARQAAEPDPVPDRVVALRGSSLVGGLRASVASTAATGPRSYHPVRGATDRHREHEYARELAGLFLASRRIDLQQLAVSIPHSYGRSLSLRPRMWLADALLGALFSSAPARRRLPRDRTP